MQKDQIKVEIRKKYDDDAKIYDNIFSNYAGKHFIKKKIAKAVSFKVIEHNQNVLEIGSATGVFSFEFESLGIKLTAVDLSSKNIEMANSKNVEKNSSVNFIIGDVESLNFSDNEFDGVISFSTLRYVPNIKQALKEINRALKPGGYIILDFPNRLCPWFGHLKKVILGREHIHDKHYLKNEIQSLITEAGFKDVKIKRGLFIPKSTPNIIFPFFYIIEAIMERIPFINIFSAIIFCYGKK